MFYLLVEFYTNSEYALAYVRTYYLINNLYHKKAYVFVWNISYIIENIDNIYNVFETRRAIVDIQGSIQLLMLVCVFTTGLPAFNSH